MIGGWKEYNAIEPTDRYDWTKEHCSCYVECIDWERQYVNFAFFMMENGEKVGIEDHTEAIWWSYWIFHNVWRTLSVILNWVWNYGWMGTKRKIDFFLTIFSRNIIVPICQK